MLFEHAPDVDFSNISKPYVRLIIGVSAGKTTTIAKLASKRGTKCNFRSGRYF